VLIVVPLSPVRFGLESEFGGRKDGSDVLANPQFEVARCVCADTALVLPAAPAVVAVMNV
jgi:hypothetical protein